MIRKNTAIAMILVLALTFAMSGVLAAGRGQGKGRGGSCPRNGTRLEGSIQSINYDTKQFILSTKDGTFTVVTNADTVIKKGPERVSFNDLKEGQYVCACGTLNGTVLTAWMVNIMPGRN